jgi:hypothetical protein
MCVYFPSSQLRLFCIKLTADVDIFQNLLLSLLKILESKLLLFIMTSELMSGRLANTAFLFFNHIEYYISLYE